MDSHLANSRVTLWPRLAWILLALLILAGFGWGIPLEVQHLERSYLGLWINQADQRVIWVVPGMPAEQSGLRPGDRIVQIERFPGSGPGGRGEIRYTYRHPDGSLHQTTRLASRPPEHVLGLPYRLYDWLSALLDGFFLLVFLAFSALIAWRAPAAAPDPARRRFAFLAAFVLPLACARLQSEFQLALGQLPNGPALVTWLLAAGYLFFALLLALFPNGRWQPGWVRFYALLGLVMTLSFGILNWLPASLRWGKLIEVGFLTLGILAQVQRYRRFATEQEQQQTRWVLAGMIAAFLAFFALQFVMDQALPLRLFPALTGSITASFLFITFSGHYYQVLLLIPVALAISVLRYRLWEIDLILRRTLIYTTLTGALAAVYFGLVLLLQMLFRLLTGESSILAIVLSTLAITLLFAPLRSGLQRFIDRRFYRRRYNADRTLAAFTAAARTEVDLDLLSGELVQVVDAALQPEHVALWLRAPVEKSLLDQNRR